MPSQKYAIASRHCTLRNMNGFQTNDLTFLEISHGSSAYEETVALREAVLRQPLGLIFTPEQLEAEHAQHHLACYQSGVLIGCLILVPNADRIIKMRQVAVTPSARGQGIGSALVKFSEAFAHDLNFTMMLVHARETAIPFYEELGYQRVGERFEEVLLPHWKMRKHLLSKR